MNFYKTYSCSIYETSKSIFVRKKTKFVPENMTLRKKQNKNYYMVLSFCTFTSSNLFFLSFLTYTVLLVCNYLKQAFFLILSLRLFILSCFGVCCFFFFFIYQHLTFLNQRHLSQRKSRWRIWFLVFFVEAT